MSYYSVQGEDCHGERHLSCYGRHALIRYSHSSMLASTLPMRVCLLSPSSTNSTSAKWTSYSSASEYPTSTHSPTCITSSGRLATTMMLRAPWRRPKFHFSIFCMADSPKRISRPDMYAETNKANSTARISMRLIIVPECLLSTFRRSLRHCIHLTSRKSRANNQTQFPLRPCLRSPLCTCEDQLPRSCIHDTPY